MTTGTLLPRPLNVFLYDLSRMGHPGRFVGLLGVDRWVLEGATC